MGMGHWKFISFIVLTVVAITMLFNIHPALAESPTQDKVITVILYPILGAMSEFSNYLFLLIFAFVGAGTFGVLYFSCKKKDSSNINSISNIQ